MFFRSFFNFSEAEMTIEEERSHLKSAYLAILQGDSKLVEKKIRNKKVKDLFLNTCYKKETLLMHAAINENIAVVKLLLPDYNASYVSDLDEESTVFDLLNFDIDSGSYSKEDYDKKILDLAEILAMLLEKGARTRKAYKIISNDISSKAIDILLDKKKSYNVHDSFKIDSALSWLGYTAKENDMLFISGKPRHSTEGENLQIENIFN